ncbi:hypothetical protein, partial [Hyphomonas jannaschiana]|uniref:hypothetical protein n=1 Tax=Hyphomonas jannaschiana TaxID=86 RepID=UPI0035C764E0
MSLFHPPAWFPPQLAFLWPIIWVQVLMLRAQIRTAYGRGVVYRWSVTDNLRVYLVSIEWMPGQKAERAWLKPAAYASDRLAAACDGRMAVPEHLRTLPLLLGEKGLGMRGKGASARAALAETSRPLTPTPLPGERGPHLPL